MNIHIVSTKALEPDHITRMRSYGIDITDYDFIKKTIKIPADFTERMLSPLTVLTSKTAAQALNEIAMRLNLDTSQYAVYCLANATHHAVSSYGLKIAGTAANASLLADEILKDKSITSVTFVCSNLRRDELPFKLREGGIRVQEIEVYKTEFTPIKIERPFDGIIFSSPSTVDSFLSMNSVNRGIAFCIGKTTADHAYEMGFRSIRQAQSPTQVSLVNAVLSHFNKPIVHAQK